MKTFTNANAQDLTEAVDLARRARQEGRTVAVSGGGSDLLAMVKERLITPDVVVNLRTAQGPDRDVSRIQTVDDGVRIGGLITLEALSQEPLIRDEFTVLAEAAGGVATPQIRHVGDPGRQRLSASVVLVLPKRLPLLQGRRHTVLFVWR